MVGFAKLLVIVLVVTMTTMFLAGAHGVAVWYVAGFTCGLFSTILAAAWFNEVDEDKW